MPIMPIVLPRTSKPRRPDRVKLPCCTRAWAATRFLYTGAFNGYKIAVTDSVCVCSVSKARNERQCKG